MEETVAQPGGEHDSTLVDALAQMIVDCGDETTRRQLRRCLLSAFPSETKLERLAQQLKLEWFDSLLHNNLEQAECMATFLYKLGRAARQPRIQALGMMAHGDAARVGGRPLRAMEHFTHAGEIFLRANDQVGWARTRGGWLLAATVAGAITEDDLTSMEAPRKVLEAAGEKYRLVMLEQKIGMTQQSFGQYQKALATYDHALAALGTGVEPHVINARGMLLMNTADVRLWLGDLDEAQQLYNRARECFTQAADSGAAAQVDMNLCVIARLRGHLREALALGQAAVDGLRQARLFSLTGLALSYRADILLLLNRPKDAVADAGEAEDVLRPLEFPVDLANALWLKAQALTRLGDEERAIAHLLECELLVTQAQSLQVTYPITTERVRIERAALLLSSGHAAQAREVALGVLATPVTDATRLHRGMALLVAAEAALALKQLGLATAEARNVIALGKRLDAPELIYRGHVVLGRVAVDSHDLHTALEHYDCALTTVQKLTSELVYDQRSGFLEDKDTFYQEALSAALALGDAPKALAYVEQGRQRSRWLLSTGHAGELPEQAKEFDELRRRHRYVSALLPRLLADDPTKAQAQQELARLSRRTLDLLEARAQQEVSPSVLDGSTIVNTVPHGKTVVAYAVLGERCGNDLAIFVLHQGRVTAQRVAGGARQLDTLHRLLQLDIATLTQELRESSLDARPALLTRWGTPLRKVLHTLWSLLLAPVEHLLPADGEALTLVPHGLLHTLPLAAMYDGQRYTIERWKIESVPSCLVLGESALPDPEDATSLLALGYSSGGALPHAPREAQQIAELFGGEAWLEEHARGERLRTEGKGRRFLHIAAHGILRSNNPTSSFVHLADGPFHATDVLLLDLHGYRLVTLSACETGLGRMSGGDEQLGLMLALHYVGAEAVLATLWRVDDASTAAFMVRLYQLLARGATPAEALRHAQLSFLREADGMRAHPAFWAGFHLMMYVLRPQHLEYPPV